MESNDAYVYKEHNKSYAKFSYIGSWKMHHNSWNNSKIYRMLTVKYEDMENDPYKTFRDVVVFINTICKFNNRVNDKKMEKSIESTNFEKLKKFEEDGSFTENRYKKDTKEKIKFFYLGKKNNWKTILNDEIKNKMNKIYKDDLIKFKYEKN